MGVFDKKPDMPQLNTETASQLLANVFESCEKEPNTVPLETLTSYSNYRRERYGLQKFIIIMFLLLFCALPICFVSPKASMHLTNENFEKYPVYEVTVDNLVPTSYVTANVDGRVIAVYETGENTYSIEPTMNGNLTVSVVLANKQYSTLTALVSGIDTESPTLVSNELISGKLYIYVDDTGSGIDYDNVYAKLLDESVAVPDHIDEEKQCIIFNYPENPMNVFIPDKRGNTLQLILTVK